MIPTHNTSFALGIAANAALEARTPTLIFSLEMSHRELTQRMLCSEARVDATRMRNGKLLESDWPKISHAVGRLGEAPIFIDDNPHLTIMEIRAKARRLKSREGLGMIVIDYMQLMSGRSNAENRQVEVSEMSRGLKILARELNVPVIALSQLSRNLESRADKRPVLADLRESGCMAGETRLLRADGTEVTLGELVLTQEHPLVWSVAEDRRLVPARLLNAFPSGVKPVFRLRLASGQTVDATANHPFLSIHGWTRLDALAPGSYLAVPRRTEQKDGRRSADVRSRQAGLQTCAAPADRTLSEVGWEEIVAITPVGATPTFDATVAGTHNFIANGIVAHNSLEQDADVVIFLYRDEVYNRDTPDRGTAEVIVAKHRNGPIGVTHLAFLDHYTRFANMARV
jgi:replicative DNA helicase